MENRENVNRPSKVDWFLYMAFVASAQSMDAQTKCGCVITNKQNRVLGMGYNSFPRKCNNESLPNLRPNKYPWMVHSERNAVNNCILSPLSCGGGTAFVTGPCCSDCTIHLWQNGVDLIYQADREAKCVNEKDEEVKEELCKQTGLEIITIQPDFEWAVNLQHA